MQKQLAAAIAPVAMLILVFIAFSLQLKAYGQNSPQAVPKEVSDLTGSFTGSWTIFGIDEKGEPVKRITWTDSIKAENPVTTGDRAFVTTTDEMIFEGGKIPPRKISGTEGYFVSKDGSLGDYFIESFGQVSRAHRLSKDVWAYVTPAAPQELSRLGFSNVLSGQHAVIKVITQEQGKETHRITRVTTVNWKDADGKDRWTQYVSLQGFHRRQ